MRQLIRLRVLVISAIAFVLIGSPSVSARTLKFATAPPANHPYTTAAKRFAELVAKNSNGSLQVNVFPASELGGERDVTENLQMGTIDVMLNSMGVTATFVPRVNVFNLPFIFRGPEHFLKVAEGPIGGKLLKDFDQAKLKGLAFCAPVFRVPMNSLRPINTPEDFKGMKIRLLEVPIHIATYKALGASPIPIPLPELYSALQLGTVNANENAIGTLSTAKLYEVQKYLTILPVISNGAVLIMSLKTWESLSPREQKAVLDAVPDTVKLLDREYEQTGEDGLKEMRAHGIQVNTPPSLDPFVKAVEPVYADYLKDHPDMKSLIDEIRNVK